MTDNILAINATIGRSASATVEGLEAKVKASMRAVLDGNWMIVDNDDALFRAGLAGALLDVGADSDDGKRLTESIVVLRKISAFFTAAQAGLSIDLSSALPEEGEEQPLPLLEWWHETKEFSQHKPENIKC